MKYHRFFTFRISLFLFFCIAIERNFVNWSSTNNYHRRLRQSNSVKLKATTATKRRHKNIPSNKQRHKERWRNLRHVRRHREQKCWHRGWNDVQRHRRYRRMTTNNKRWLNDINGRWMSKWTEHVNETTFKNVFRLILYTWNFVA